MISFAGQPFQNISRKHIDNFAILQLDHLIIEPFPVILEIF
jgi:hypothetical protein